MRKTVAYSAIFLLIASTLLVTATAKKPQPDTTYTLTFTGDISGEIELSCRDRGGKLDLYGKPTLTFNGDIWNFNDFKWEGSHEGIMRIFISKETGEVIELFYDFDKQLFSNGNYYPLYSLHGPNPDGTYDISQIFIERSGKGKKGALSLRNDYITSLPLDFEVTVVS